MVLAMSGQSEAGVSTVGSRAVWGEEDGDGRGGPPHAWVPCITGRTKKEFWDKMVP